MQKRLKFLQKNVKENRMWSKEKKITTLWGNSQILLRNLTSTGGAIWAYWWKLFLQSIWFLVFVNHFEGFLCECYNWTTAHLVMRDFGTLILKKSVYWTIKITQKHTCQRWVHPKNSDSTKCWGFALLMESRVGTSVTLLPLLVHPFRIVAISTTVILFYIEKNLSKICQFFKILNFYHRLHNVFFLVNWWNLLLLLFGFWGSDALSAEEESILLRLVVTRFED